MNARTLTHRTAITLTCAAALALAGCGKADDAAPKPVATQSSPATTADAPASDGGSDQASTTATGAESASTTTDDAETTGEGTATDSESSSGSDATATDSSSAESSSTSSASGTVSEKDFPLTNAPADTVALAAFQSPSGDWQCNYTQDPVDTAIVNVSCTGTMPPGTQAQMFAGDQPEQASVIDLGIQDESVLIAPSDNLFEGERKTLNPGQKLSVHGITCTTTAGDGVSCKSDKSGHGFEVSKKNIKQF